jgi:hypothetical protein
MSKSKKAVETAPAEVTPGPLALGVSDFATVAGLKRNTAYWAVRTGSIPSFRLGNKSYVLASEIPKWLASLSGKRVA